MFLDIKIARAGQKFAEYCFTNGVVTVKVYEYRGVCERRTVDVHAGVCFVHMGVMDIIIYNTKEA